MAKKEFAEYSHYRNHFDWLLMQALFISGFSYFENFMRSVAYHIEKSRGTKIKIKDIKGNGYLDTYRKYIHLIGEIEFANHGKKEWVEITEFKKNRNAITNEYGEISIELNKIKQHNIYFGSSKKIIRIKNVQFLEDFTETTINYMNSLVSEVKNKIYDG